MGHGSEAGWASACPPAPSFAVCDRVLVCMEMESALSGTAQSRISAVCLSDMVEDAARQFAGAPGAFPAWAASGAMLIMKTL